MLQNHPEIAFTVILTVFFGVVAASTLRMKYLWTPHVCVVAAGLFCHQYTWRWIFYAGKIKEGIVRFFVMSSLLYFLFLTWIHSKQLAMCHIGSLLRSYFTLISLRAGNSSTTSTNSGLGNLHRDCGWKNILAMSILIADSLIEWAFVIILLMGKVFRERPHRPRHIKQQWLSWLVRAK